MPADTLPDQHLAKSKMPPELNTAADLDKTRFSLGKVPGTSGTVRMVDSGTLVVRWVWGEEGRVGLQGHFPFPGGVDSSTSEKRSWADKEGSGCRYEIVIRIRFEDLL